MRRSLIVAVGLSLALFVQGAAMSGPQTVDGQRRFIRDDRASNLDGYVPALIRARQLGRYFVEMKAPAAADVLLRRGSSVAAPTRDAAAEAMRSQESAIGQVRSLGGSAAASHLDPPHAQVVTGRTFGRR